MAEMMFGEQELRSPVCIGVDLAQVLEKQPLQNSFSLSHSGMALRKDPNPRGANIR